MDEIESEEIEPRMNMDKKHPQNRTRIPRIARIFTDTFIRGHPRNPRSIRFALEGKNSYQWPISLLT
ncbi:MAG: hypothetical protein LUQ20_05085 [Candidatus Methanoperedens sp.]|nr:hypothetical protein [Candidatus Methanoperedens sp.]